MRNHILNVKCFTFLFAISLLTYGTYPVSSLEIESVTLNRTTPRWHSATPQEIASIALNSTVLIETQSGFGSGFVVDEGQVATNYHVIEGMVSGTAQLVGSTTKHTVEGVLAVDIPRDLAIIKVRGLSAPVLPLGDSDTVQIGQDVYAVGNPQGLQGTFSPGVISAIRSEGNSLVAGKVFQITAPISPGSSGGPVLDSDAEVIGIAVGSDTGGQNLNFAIPVNYLKTLLTQRGAVQLPQQKFVYWVDVVANEINRVTSDGENVETLVTRSQGLVNPQDIALDVAGGKMYWTDYGYSDEHGSEKIVRANLDGSNIETLVTRSEGLEGPWGIALDVVGGKMYWADKQGKKIVRANLDGTNIETLVTRGLVDLGGIALDVVGGKMYYVDYGDPREWGKEKIARANLDGSNIEILISGRRAGGPQDIALDVAGGKIYYVDVYNSRIVRANLDGSNIESLIRVGASATGSPQGIALDVAAGKLFFTTTVGTGVIVRANLDGSNIQTLVRRVQGEGFALGIDISLPYQTVSPPVVQTSDSDLIVEPPTVSKSTLSPGESFTLSTAVTNQGAGNAPSTTLRYYRSTDATITTSDTEVGTDSVSGLGADERGTESISLTAPTSPGTYYYGACVDSVSDESNSNNNCSAAVSITVELPNLILSVSTTVPLTEANLDGSVVTLTLSGGTFGRPFNGITGGQIVSNSVLGVEVSGIPGVTIPLESVPSNVIINGVRQDGIRYAIDRISDTELEVELAFDGTDFDSDATITFTVTAEAIAGYTGPELTAQVSVTAIKAIEFDLSVPAGISLIHVPLNVTNVNGAEKTLKSISDLYDALGGEDNVIYLFTRDSQTQQWVGYLKPSDRGTSVDRGLTDDMGIITNLITPTPLHLSGRPLGTDGNSTITLNPGINLVGVPLRDSRITHVSDLFTLEGTVDNILVIMVQDNNGAFKQIRLTSSTDIAITGGQSFIMTALQATTVDISGEAWTNAPEAAAPLMAMRGIELDNVTPILALTGSIVAEGTRGNQVGIRVTAKNLSTGREVTATVTDALDYRLAVVDIESGWAAQIGDIVEISGQSPNPFVGVEPLRYTVTAEDVKQSLIQLPSLIAYEIPAETELLSNYPNPFNPETWMPYRLASDTDVLLSIYDINGALVRELDLGHQQAGYYTDRSRAAYWDGRNEWGESVASGVYFYQLRAGDYSQMRKMVILK